MNIFECPLSREVKELVLTRKGKLTGLHPVYMPTDWVYYGFLFGKITDDRWYGLEVSFLFLTWGVLAKDRTRFKLTLETLSTSLFEWRFIVEEDALEKAKKEGINKSTFASFLTEKDPLQRYVARQYVLPLFKSL